MRPMLARLPWEHSSSSTCTCHMKSSPLSSLLSSPLLPCLPETQTHATCYLGRCVPIWPQFSAHRCSAETPAGLLPLPLLLSLLPLLHLFQLSLLVALLQVLHQNGHDHVDQHKLSGEHEGDEVNGGDQGQIGEAVAILGATLTQGVLDNED